MFRINGPRRLFATSGQLGEVQVCLQRRRHRQYLRSRRLAVDGHRRNKSVPSGRDTESDTESLVFCGKGGKIWKLQPTERRQSFFRTHCRIATYVKRHSRRIPNPNDLRSRRLEVRILSGILAYWHPRTYLFLGPTGKSLTDFGGLRRRLAASGCIDVLAICLLRLPCQPCPRRAQIGKLFVGRPLRRCKSEAWAVCAK